MKQGLAPSGETAVHASVQLELREVDWLEGRLTDTLRALAALPLCCLYIRFPLAESELKRLETQIKEGGSFLLERREPETPLAGRIYYAPEAQRAMAQTLVRILEGSKDLICTMDTQLNPRSVSASVFELLGYSTDEWIGKPFLSYVHEAFREEAKVSLEKLVNGEEVGNFDCALKAKSGQKRLFVWSARLDSSGQRVVCVGRDVTDQKLAEEDVRFLIDNTEDRFVLVGPDLTIRSFNKQFGSSYLELFQREVKAGDSILDYTLPDRREATEEVYKDVFAGKPRQTHLDLEKDGQIHSASISFKPLWDDDHKQVIAAFVTARDITEEQATLRALSESNERYNYIVQATSDAIWDWDLLAEKVIWTEGFETLFGYPSGERSAHKREWYSRIHPDERDRVYDGLDIAFEDPEKVYWREEYQVRRADGSYAFVVDRGVIIRNEKGKALRIVGAVQDVSEQKELEVLNQQAGRLAQIGSWKIEVPQNNVFWSDLTRKIHGVDRNFEVSMDSIQEFYEIDGSRERLNQAAQRAILEGVPWDMEVLIRTAHGEEKWVRVIGEPLFIDGQCVEVYGSFQDIDRLKRTEIQLEQRTRYLEAISRINSLLIKVEDWTKAMELTFELVSDAVEVDRIYYFEFIEENERLYLSQRVEWNRESVDAQIDNPNLAMLPAEEVGDFIEQLINQEVVQLITSQLAHSKTRELLEDQSIKSAIMQPLLIAGRVKGFIGFDDCREERSWSSEEVDFLKTITVNLTSALEKYEAAKATEAALNERNQILESIGDGFFALNRSGEVVYWNATATEILRKKRNETIGSRVQDFFHQTNLKGFEDAYLEAKGTGEPVLLEAPYEELQLWLAFTFYPDGENMSVFFRDVTASHRAEKLLRDSNERFELAMRATKDALYDWDIENDILLWGSGFQTLFGFEVINFEPTLRGWEENLHPNEQEQVNRSMEEALNNPSADRWLSEYRFQKANGNFATVRDKGLIIRNADGEAIRMVGAMEDITARKEHEQALIELNRQLERQKASLARSNSELEQFAYVASHDLQEPLRMVTSFLTQIEQKYGEALDERGKQYIRFAVDGGIRMREIIQDLLAYSRIKREEGEFSPCRVDAVLEDVRQLNRHSIEEKSAQLSWGKMPEVMIDKVALQQVFHNLIGNALKYQRENTAPKIAVACTESEDNWQFSVEDNGIGIEERYFERIFVIFQRLHQKGAYGGTGMGLAIVKKIIDAWGGTIHLESTPGKGSKFYFTIPKKNDHTQNIEDKTITPSL